MNHLRHATLVLDQETLDRLDELEAEIAQSNERGRVTPIVACMQIFPISTDFVIALESNSK